MRFLVNLELPSWFLCFRGWRPTGFELVEAKSIGDAYEQVQRDITAGLIFSKKWRIYTIIQVNDDAKPDEIKTMVQKEMIFRHEENMAKYAYEKIKVSEK